MEQTFPENQLKSSTIAGTGRQVKHMESVEMIARFQQTQSRLQDLIDEISGQPVDVVGHDGANNRNRDLMSLSEFLNATPEALASMNSRLEDQIGHLRDLLL